jgi:Zn-dependent protease
LALTVVVFLATVLRHGGQQPLALACYAAGVSVLAGAAIRVRALVGRASGEHRHQVSWPPGMLLGAGSAVVGVPWAPLPVLDRAEARARLHSAAPFLLTALTIPLLVEAVWLDVPLTRSLAVAALVMAASTLVPVPPLDGGSLDRRQLLAGSGIVCAATLTLFGVL